MSANAGEVRKVATLDEEESKKRAARQARFAAAPEDQAADARTAAKRHAWPGGTMTVVMPGKQPRTVVTQGSVRTMEVDGDDESEVTRTTPAEPAAASAGATAKASLKEKPTRAAVVQPTARPRGPRHTESAAGGGRRPSGGASASKTGVGGERGETEMKRSPPQRGTYITFLEGFHGQGAVGAMSLTAGRKNLGVTWQGGFGVWATATELARDRHGFEPLSADANDVFEQTEILPRADAAAMGSPCQQASWAAWVATQGTERQCAPPDGDHPMNQLYWRQVQPMKRRVKALLIEFPTGVLKVESASDPTKEPGFLHHRMLKEIETADEAVGSVCVDTQSVDPELKLSWVGGAAEEAVYVWSITGRGRGG